jgi:hypothetical protein
MNHWKYTLKFGIQMDHNNSKNYVLILFKPAIALMATVRIFEIISDNTKSSEFEEIL